MSFAKFGAEIWRDFVTAGVPGSGVWNVDKADMRAWMAAVEADLGAVNYIPAGWSQPESFVVGDVVWHNGVDYVSTEDHTSGASTEPGVGGDWQDVWALFAPSLNPSGNAAAPGIAFGADPDTGLFRLAADVMGIAAGGAAAAYFSAAGIFIPTGNSLAFQDADGSHNLLVDFGSDLTANRILSLLTGDNARTIDISAADLLLSAFGASLIDDAAASNARTTLGIVIGTDVQAWDATLASIAALGTAADRIAYTTGVDTWAETPLTTFGRSLIDDAAASNARTTLGLVIGTDVQAWDVLLESLAALADPNADRISFWDDSAGNLGWLALAGGASIDTTTLRIHESLVIAVSDEDTPLTAGNAKITFRMPYAFTPTSVRASLTTAQTGDGGGGIFTVDINEGGTTILSTKITIDNTEKTSTTAATPPVISDVSLADDAEMTIDIDQIGDGTAVGLKVYLIGYRP